MVAVGAALGVQLGDGGREPVERVVVVEGALHEAQALGEPVPDLGPERGAGVLAHRVVDDLGEVLVRPVPTGEPDQREAGRQQPRFARS